MLNDYKPTHDPNIDTLQVQYLLGGSALLAVLFPYRYEVAEVCTFGFRTIKSGLIVLVDALGFQHMARIGSNPPPAVYASKNWGSRDNNDTLPVRVRAVPSIVHSELAVQVFRGRIRRSDSLDRWAGSNGAVLGFLLDLLYQVSSRSRPLGIKEDELKLMGSR